MKTAKRHVGLSICLVACLASAQYAIDRYTFAGGSGVSTGGGYSVSGTVGQADAGGPLTNGPCAVIGGFWTVPIMVQRSGMPSLHIINAAPGVVTIWWTPSTPGYVLQSSDSLSPTNWINAPTGTTNPATISSTMPGRFYRLFNP